VIALILALSSVVLRRTQLGPGKLHEVGSARGGQGVARHLLNFTLISAALGEAVAILGLMLTMLSGDSMDVIRLAAVALVVVLLAYPRRTSWDRAVEHYT
jgi:hypothetical protein